MADGASRRTVFAHTTDAIIGIKLAASHLVDERGRERQSRSDRTYHRKDANNTRSMTAKNSGFVATFVRGLQPVIRGYGCLLDATTPYI